MRLRPARRGFQTSQLIVGVVLLALTFVPAYARQFGAFLAYDDEGFMLMTVRHFLAGPGFYDRVSTVYGPFYYFYEWLVHRVARVPVTTDGTRLVSLGFWLSTSLLMGFAGWRFTGRKTFGVLGYVAALTFLGHATNEPGHPQEMVGLMLALTAALAARGLSPDGSPGTRSAFWAAGGGVTAALVLTKLNVGVLMGVSFALAMAFALPPTRWATVLRWLALAAAIALPLAVLGRRLSEPWAAQFAARLILGVLAVAIVAGRPAGILGARDFGLFVGMAVLVAAGTVGFARALGSSLWAMIDGIILAPARLASSTGGALRVLGPTVVGAVLSVVCAGVVHRLRSRGPAAGLAGLLTAAKLAGGLAALLAFGSGRPSPVIGFLVPWAWLALAGSGSQFSPAIHPGRVVVVLIAVLQPFQIYPVPGTQMYLGSLMMLPIALTWLSDGLEGLGAGRWAKARWRESAGPAGAIGLSVVLMAARPLGWLREFREQKPLDLPGARRLRLPADQVDQLRWLVATAQGAPDGVLFLEGLNSVYFWSGSVPVTTLVVGNTLDAFSPAQLTRLQGDLESRPRLRIVRALSPLQAILQTRDDNPVRLYLEQKYTVRERRHGFEVLERKPPAAGK